MHRCSPQTGLQRIADPGDGRCGGPPQVNVRPNAAQPVTSLHPACWLPTGVLGAVHAENPSSVVSLRRVGPMKAGSWLTLGPPVKEPMLGCVLSCFGAGASGGTRSSGNGVVLMPMPGAATVAALSRSTPKTPVVTVGLILANETASGLPQRTAIHFAELASLPSCHRVGRSRPTAAASPRRPSAIPISTSTSTASRSSPPPRVS
jgi:hypothetical protein